MDAIIPFINWLDDFIWGIPMIVLLLGTHLFMTARTGFIQRKLFTGIRLSVTKDPDSPGDVSQFQALTTALASTIGTGNIIGVGTAIFLGGPGAVFWCWIAGVFGIATKYAESLIAVKYRVRTRDGKMQGGAMYALRRTMAAGFTADQAVPLEALQARGEELLLPTDSLFAGHPILLLKSDKAEKRVRCGNPITLPGTADGTYRVYSQDRQFLCLSQARDGVLTSIKNFFGA